MKKYVYALLFGLPLLFVAYISVFYFNQEWLIFRFQPLPENYTFHWKEPHQELFFKREDGARINALYFKARDPKGVVFYCHGRGGNIGTNWGLVAEDFTKRQYDILTFDYRGSGKSQGKLSEEAILNDANHIYSYLLEMYPEEKIIVYGRSLGTSIATYVASKHRPKLLLLESPFTSMIDLAQMSAPLMPKFVARLILKYSFHTDEWIQKVSSPIKIFHGTDDALVPYENSLRLFAIVKDREDVEFTTIEKGQHDYIRRHPLYMKKLSTSLN